VLVFVRADCPIANRYAPELRRLHEDYSPRGVAFWLVYPDPEATPETIGSHLAEYGHVARALYDPEHALVEHVGASVTPEAALFRGPRMLYRGRIDDRFVDFGKTRAAPSRRDLRDALDAALSGEDVPAPRTRAVGCFIGDLR